MDASGVAFLRRLLPNAKLLRLRAATAVLERPDPDCVLDVGPALEYFAFGRGFAPSFGILLAYWAGAHALTYAALRAVARKEAR